MGKDNLSNTLSKRIGEQKHEPHSIDRDYDEMYGLNYSNANENIVELDIALLKSHPKDPFKPYAEDKLKELSDSIAKLCLLDSVHVRPDGNGQYEILAGKNRTNATKLHGDKKIKAIVRDVDEETAIMIITDSNLKHREKLLPS